MKPDHMGVNPDTTDHLLRDSGVSFFLSFSNLDLFRLRFIYCKMLVVDSLRPLVVKLFPVSGY